MRKREPHPGRFCTTPSCLCPPRSEAQTDPKWHPKRIKSQEFSRTKNLLSKSLLEPPLADLGAFCKPYWAQKKIVFVLDTYKFMKNYVFDEEGLSRYVLDRTWPNPAAKRGQDDPKLAIQHDPASVKNRIQKMIKK